MCRLTLNVLCLLGPSSNLDLRRLIVERQAAPDILLSGLINNDDVGKLFDMYVYMLFGYTENYVLTDRQILEMHKRSSHMLDCVI